MGLSVGVGMLADLAENDPEGAEWLRESIDSLNGLLRANGYRNHVEPESMPEFEYRAADGLPYSFLHGLRRCCCCVLKGETLRTGDLTKADEKFIERTSTSFSTSHLLNHSDSEGLYVPIELSEPLWDDGIPGYIVGSSQALMTELFDVADPLGIAHDGTHLSPSTISWLVDIQEHHPQYEALVAWFALYEASRISIEHNTLIVFT